MRAKDYDFSACNGCSLCLLVCPSWRRRRDLRLTAHGFAKALQHDEAPGWDDLLSCGLCGACDPVCPRPVKPTDMILDLRRRHMRERDHNDIRGQVAAARENIARADIGGNADSVLLPDMLLAGRTRLLNQVKELLGPSVEVAGDAGEDIVLAVEAGLDVPEGRLGEFLRPLESAKTVIAGDGLLFRALRGWMPHKSIRSLGEALSIIAGVRAQVRENDLYLVESRAYHADFPHLRRYYRQLQRIRDCVMNIDLQGAAIPTGAVSMRPLEVKRQVDWILHGRHVERVVAESLADADAVARYSDVPVTYLGQLTETHAYD